MIESRRVKELSTHEEDLDGIKNGHPDSRVSKFERFTARYRVFSSFILLWRLPISANALNTANLRVDVTHVYVCNRSGGRIRHAWDLVSVRLKNADRMVPFILPPHSATFLNGFHGNQRERKREKEYVHVFWADHFFSHFLSDLI